MSCLTYSIAVNFGGVSPIISQLCDIIITASYPLSSAWIDGDVVGFQFGAVVDAAAINAIVAAYVRTPVTRYTMSRTPGVRTVLAPNYTIVGSVTFPGSTYIKVSVDSYLLNAGSYNIRVIDKTNATVLITGTFSNTSNDALVLWGTSSAVSSSRAILELQCNSNGGIVNLSTITIDYA